MGDDDSGSMEFRLPALIATIYIATWATGINE
jgi:hypothetical protein